MPFLGFVSESSLFCVLVYTNMKTLFYYFTFCGDFYLRKYEETKLLITEQQKRTKSRKQNHHTGCNYLNFELFKISVNCSAVLTLNKW